jgi:hypothetical protein
MDPANADFQRVRIAIAAGTCREIEPEITSAVRTFGVNGEITGFDTNVGFLPNDQSCDLFRVFESSVAAGTCVISDPQSETIAAGEQVETLIVCLLFQRAWPHLTGTFERTFPYRSSVRSSPIDLLVRLRNIPSEEPLSAFQLLQEAHLSLPAVPFRGLPLQAGVLEIEIPVAKLLRLFRSEKPSLDEEWAPFLTDFLAQHLVRSGRTESRGPDRQWLIGAANWYLGRLAMSLGNVVIRAFVLEWGGVPPGYVKRDALYRHGIILGRLANGGVRWQGGGPTWSQSFALSGIWPDHGAAIREVLYPEENPLGHRRHIPRRVRQMADAGFTMEAIALLSAFIEVFVRDALIAAVFPDREAIRATVKIGHRARLDVLRKLNSTDAGFSHPIFSQTLTLAFEIYKHRNEYLHDLALPSQEAWLSADKEKEIERLISAFAEPWEQTHRFGFITNLWHANAGTKEFLVSAILNQRRPLGC